MCRAKGIIGAAVVIVLLSLSYDLVNGQAATEPTAGGQPAAGQAAEKPAVGTTAPAPTAPAGAAPAPSAPAAPTPQTPAPATPAPATPTPVAKTPVPPALPANVPYIGKITGDNVHIRSGPGDIWYPVGKIEKDQPVVVVEEKFGWCKIEPTKQCFSVVSKEFVKLTETPTPASEAPKDQAGTAKGVVKYGKTIAGEITGNNVRVRAGSDRVTADNASEVQMTLNQGAKVEVIGDWGNFYLIVPPKGSYFWVSKAYAKRTGEANAAAQDAMRAQAGKDALTKPIPAVTTPAAGSSAAAKAAKTQEDSWWEKYQSLVKEFEVERTKPVADQNFTAMQAKLSALQDKADSAWLKRNAENLGEQMTRSQLAADASRQSKQQNEQLQAAVGKIDEKMNLLVKEMPYKRVQDDMTVKGILRYSAVFSKNNPNRRFLVIDDNGQILCCAVAGAEGIDLVNWVDKRIALKGQVVFDSFSVDQSRIMNAKQIEEISAGEPAPSGQLDEKK